MFQPIVKKINESKPNATTKNSYQNNSFDFVQFTFCFEMLINLWKYFFAFGKSIFNIV